MRLTPPDFLSFASVRVHSRLPSPSSSAPPPLSPRIARVLTLALGAALAFGFYEKYLRVFWEIPLADYFDYYQSVQTMLAGGNPHGGNFVYPIFFDWLILPFGLLGRAASLAWFRAANVAALGWIAWMTGDWALRERPVEERWNRAFTRVAAAAAVLWFNPAFVVVRMGQGDVFVTAFLAGAWVAARRERPLGAGALCGCATLAKVAPVLVFPALLAWRPRRVFLGGALVAALYAVALLATGMWAWEWEFVMGRLLERTRETTWNQISIMQMAARFPGAFGGGANPLVVGRVCGAVAVVAYLAACARGWARRERGEMMLALGVASALVALPVLQYHHLVWMMVPLGVVGLEAARSGRRGPWIVFAAAWILAAFPNSLYSSMSVPRWVEFAPTLGLIALWVWLLARVSGFARSPREDYTNAAGKGDSPQRHREHREENRESAVLKRKFFSMSFSVSSAPPW